MVHLVPYYSFVSASCFLLFLLTTYLVHFTYSSYLKCCQTLRNDTPSSINAELELGNNISNDKSPSHAGKITRKSTSLGIKMSSSSSTAGNNTPSPTPNQFFKRVTLATMSLFWITSFAETCAMAMHTANFLEGNLSEKRRRYADYPIFLASFSWFCGKSVLYLLLAGKAWYTLLSPPTKICASRKQLVNFN